MSCGCRNGVTQNESVHRSNEILIMFYCFSLNVLTSTDILILWSCSGSKCVQILNTTLLLPWLLLCSKLMISWKCWYYIGFTIPFEFIFYGASLCSSEFVNLSLTLSSLLDGPTYDLYDIFMIELTNIPRSLLRPPRIPEDAPRTPQGPPKAPQGPPGDP